MTSIDDQLKDYYPEELCKYYSNEFKYFDQNKYLVHPFQSPVPRINNSNLAEDKNDIQKNDKFPLLFYTPNDLDMSGVEHLVIMLNGFNEKKSLVKQYADPAWGISHLLDSNSNKVSSVLLPLTFHYWRKPSDITYYSDHDPSFFIYDNPVRFYLGYRQIMYDIDAILKLVKNPTSNLKKLFLKPPMIHLYGFSVGGLGILSFILKDQLDGKGRINSATLLNSAGSLDAFTFSITGLSKSQVVELKKFYYSKSFEYFVTDELKDTVKSDDERIYRIFEYRVLGYKAIGSWRKLILLAYKQAMLGIKRKLLFINGIDDKEIIEEKIFQSIPFSIGKKNKIQVKGLGHIPSWSRDWKNHGKAKETIDFIRKHMEQNSKNIKS